MICVCYFKRCFLWNLCYGLYIKKESQILYHSIHTSVSNFNPSKVIYFNYQKPNQNKTLCFSFDIWTFMIHPFESTVLCYVVESRCWKASYCHFHSQHFICSWKMLKCFHFYCEIIFDEKQIIFTFSCFCWSSTFTANVARNVSIASTMLDKWFDCVYVFLRLKQK